MLKLLSSFAVILLIIGCNHEPLAQATPDVITITPENTNSILKLTNYASEFVLTSASQRASQLATDAKIQNRSLQGSNLCSNGGQIEFQSSVQSASHFKLQLSYQNCAEGNGLITGYFDSDIHISDDYLSQTSNIDGQLRFQLGDEFIAIKPIALTISSDQYASTIRYEMHYEVKSNQLSGHFQAKTLTPLTIDLTTGLSGSEIISGNNSEIIISHSQGDSTLLVNQEPFSNNNLNRSKD